jgi:heme/copper-type cytochrome/quinol oxidase subunit 2
MRFDRLLNLAWLMATLAASALAQCSMCKANVSNAENSAQLAPTVNAAILALLIPTIVIIGGLVRLVFKYRNLQDTHDDFRPPGSQRDPQ